MSLRAWIVATAAIFLALLLLTPGSAEGQGRGRGSSGPVASASVGGATISLSIGDRELIREFYASHTHSGVEALPPGIRRNLARGKPLPPGIAKKAPPTELLSRIRVPGEFEVVEVGLDVFLVEVATGLIHDALMDVIR